MKILVSLSIFLAFFAVSSGVRAQDCDCSKTVGMCSASFKVTNITGAKDGPAHAADVELRSSQPRCSKISFFVDNTPYLSVLNNSNSATENVFGTSAISEKSVSIDYCRICALTSAGQGAEPAQHGDAMTQRFNVALEDAAFDKDAQVQAVAARASDDLAGSQQDGMLDVINALGAMQGALRQSNARRSEGASGADPMIRNTARQMKIVPSYCGANPSAPGCAYHTNPNGYDVVPSR